MADERKDAKKDAADTGSPMNDIWFVIGILAVLGLLWYVQGGPQKITSGGLFITPSLQSTSTTATTTP